jgi:hypothetical protein
VDTVVTSDDSGETCTSIWPETTESSTETGEEDTRVYTQSVDISDEDTDCKRGVQFRSPSSTTPVEMEHTGTLEESGYSVENGASYGGEEEEWTGDLLK